MPPAAGHVYHRLDPRRAAFRLLIGLALGVLVAVSLPAGTGTPERVVAGWDAGALVYLVLAWTIIARSDAAATRQRAATADPGRTTVWAVLLASSTFSLFAATVVLRQARRLAPGAELRLAMLCLGAVVLAWLLTHTSNTLRYAHLYYRDESDDGCGGLEFPGKTDPDYLDFAYFGFTVGMCFQVSDVTVTSRSIRRAVLGHAVLSFAYNTAILALALNLLTGLLG